jgi:uncharacterized coiled-coil protein SlyX
MKRSISMLGGIVLAATLSAPALAASGSSTGKSPVAGGLPALEKRVTADEAVISALHTSLTTLQTSVTTLQGQVSTLQTQLGATQGQNNWAVVASDGTLNRSHSTAGAVTATHVATGQYEVTFSKDVSGCAFEGTIGDVGVAAPAQGQISVAGDTDTDTPNDVYVQTFDVAGTVATDSPFHLYVSCP